MLCAFAPSLTESICHQNRACVSTRVREGTQIFEVSNVVRIFVVERLRNRDPSLQCPWPTLPNLPINRNQFETATLCPLSSYLDDISRGGKVQQLGQASFRVAKCELVRHLQPSKNAPHFANVATLRNIQSQFFRPWPSLLVFRCFGDTSRGCAFNPLRTESLCHEHGRGELRLDQACPSAVPLLRTPPCPYSSAGRASDL